MTTSIEPFLLRFSSVMTDSPRMANNTGAVSDDCRQSVPPVTRITRVERETTDDD